MHRCEATLVLAMIGDVGAQARAVAVGRSAATIAALLERLELGLLVLARRIRAHASRRHPLNIRLLLLLLLCAH